MVDFRLRTRTFKELFMLQHKYECIFAHTTDRLDNKELLNKVKFRKIRGKKQLLQLVKIEKPDVIHTHNHPDELGKWALEIKKKTGVPVVHEVHDMAYEHASKTAKQMEKAVLPNVDHIITVGPGMSRLIRDKYRVSSTTIFAYPNRNLLPRIQKNTIPNRGIYQGGIRAKDNPKSKFNHRYYGRIFRKLLDQGLTIDVYPAYELKGKSVLGLNFKNHEPNIRKLYKKISTYGFGFVGYNQTRSGVMDIAMPNKLFEYCCLTPVIAMDYHDIAKFVRRNGLGVVVDKKTLRLPDDYNERMLKAKEKIIRNRNNYTMETQMIKLCKVYRRCLS